MKKESSKNKGAKGAVETTIPVVTVPAATTPVAEVATQPATTTAVTQVPEKRKPGRPKSKVAVEKVPGKKGRPIVEGSKRQARVAELEAKRAAGALKRGRPKMDAAELATRRAEAKAKKDAEKQAKLEAIKTLEKSNEEIAATANTAIASLTEAEA
jgi:hypothetical protein